MGQRHQLFIIARVGTRYRVLAALHHQWLYGFTAVRQSLQLVKLLQAEKNQGHIRRELQQAALRWAADQHEIDDSQAAVFPFLTTCLLLGASLDEYGDYAPSCQIQPLPINTRYDAMTNDDGISVYDVTKAPKIRYCFCPLANSPEPIISAQDYYKDYSDGEGSTDTHHATWEEFSKLDLIDAAALESAWEQSKFWNDPRSGPVAGVPDHPNEPRKDATLKETVKTKLVMEAFKTDPTQLDWFEVADKVHGIDMEWAIKAKLLQQPDVIALPFGATLFQRYVIGDSTYIDLTPYPRITGETVCVLMEHLAKTMQAYELVLPDIMSLQIEELRKLINTGAIASLPLGNTPNIKLMFIVKLVSSSSIQHSLTSVE